MDEKINLPFKVGDLAEAKTFEDGFRGAWFRCKIIEISTREGKIGHVSEYYDFPDEKLEWTQLYQMTPYHVGRTRERKIELMFRPPYPPIYRKSQMPLVSEISEVTVIVDGAWKVGDLVDWWTTDCYWSGTITKLYGNCKATIELKQPPIGEGDTYNVLLKDIRPSLDWSPDRGWTVPPQGEKNGRVCAWIIKPLKRAREARQDIVPGSKKDESEDKRSGMQTQGSEDRRTSEQPKVPHKNHGDGGGVVQTQGSEDRRTSEQPQVPHKNLGAGGGVDQTQGSEDRRTSEQSQVPHKNHGAGGSVVQTQGSEDRRTSDQAPFPHKNHGAGGGVTHNTLEAAIMDLEELVNKVKWIKKILEHGVSFPDVVRPEWEFVDQSPASSAPK